MILRTLNKAIIRRLESLGVTHYSIEKNFDHPHCDAISSIHFFTSNRPNAVGGFPEVAHFTPALHIKAFGLLTGFHEVSRINALTVNIKPMPNTLKADLHFIHSQKSYPNMPTASMGA